MALKKKPTIGNGLTSKGKFIATIGDIVSPSSLNLSLMEEYVTALSQGQPEMPIRCTNIG